MIDRFLAKRFAGNLLLVLCVVCGIIFATAFMQEIAASPLTQAVNSSFSHFLEMFPMFLPLVAFMGTLLTFYKLLLSSELVIIQSSGLSTYEIMRPMLLTSVIFGAITATVINPLATKYNRTELMGQRIEKIDNAIWLREKTDAGSIVIRATGMKNSPEDGLVFSNATLIKQNEKYQITERASADILILENGVISAKNALILDSKGIQSRRDFDMSTSLSRKNIIRQYLKSNQVSFWALPEFIKTLKSMGAPATMHTLQFLSLLFLPFVLVSMTVLGVLFSRTKQRRNFSFTKQFGLGIVVCFVVYFIIQIFNAMGSSGAMAPVLAAFFPPVIVLFFAATAITRSDNI